jgi:hypothetical protein
MVRAGGNSQDRWEEVVPALTSVSAPNKRELSSTYLDSSPEVTLFLLLLF